MFGYCSGYEKEKNEVGRTYSENGAWKNIQEE
jgi:hypothetical protein